MGDLSKNFSRHEFKCKCGNCEQIGPDPQLVIELQALRDYFDAPVTIHSGHRCPAYNARVKGAKGSQHLKGTAADISVKGITHNTVQRYLLRKYPNQYGIGRYNTFTHLDVRPWKARWDLRK